MSTTVTYKGQTITTAENQTKKLLTAGKYMEDDVTIEDVTSGGTVILKDYVLRPDAELIQTYSEDVRVVEDLGLTIPPYQTSAYTFKSQSPLTPSVPIGVQNIDAYDFYAAFRWLAYPIYDDNQIIPYMPEFLSGSGLLEGVVFPRDVIKMKDGNYYGNRTFLSSLSTSQVGLYWGNISTPSVSGINIGPNCAFSGVNPNQTSWTLYSPTLRITANSSYFAQAAWEKMTDIRYQWIIEVFRSPRNNLNIDGWGLRQGDEQIIDCWNNSRTLT